MCHSVPVHRTTDQTTGRCTLYAARRMCVNTLHTRILAWTFSRHTQKRTAFEIDRSINNKCIPHLIDVVRQRRSCVDVYYGYYFSHSVCVCVCPLRCVACFVFVKILCLFAVGVLSVGQPRPNRVSRARYYQRVRLTRACGSTASVREFPFQLRFVIIHDYVRINISYGAYTLSPASLVYLRLRKAHL